MAITSLKNLLTHYIILSQQVCLPLPMTMQKIDNAENSSTRPDRIEEGIIDELILVN